MADIQDCTCPVYHMPLPFCIPVLSVHGHTLPLFFYSVFKPYKLEGIQWIYFNGHFRKRNCLLQRILQEIQEFYRITRMSVTKKKVMKIKIKNDFFKVKLQHIWCFLCLACFEKYLFPIKKWQPNIEQKSTQKPMPTERKWDSFLTLILSVKEKYFLKFNLKNINDIDIFQVKTGWKEWTEQKKNLP